LLGLFCSFALVENMVKKKPQSFSHCGFFDHPECHVAFYMHVDAMTLHDVCILHEYLDTLMCESSQD
jgi:hypothetical protein